jgi:hypothetical protein
MKMHVAHKKSRMIWFFFTQFCFIFLLQAAFKTVTGILREASQILEGGHYAAGHVRSVATRLETTWKVNWKYHEI